MAAPLIQACTSFALLQNLLKNSFCWSWSFHVLKLALIEGSEIRNQSLSFSFCHLILLAKGFPRFKQASRCFKLVGRDLALVFDIGMMWDLVLLEPRWLLSGIGHSVSPAFIGILFCVRFKFLDIAFQSQNGFLQPLKCNFCIFAIELLSQVESLFAHPIVGHLLLKLQRATKLIFSLSDALRCSGLIDREMPFWLLNIASSSLNLVS